MLTIAISKGRLLQESLNLLHNLGIEFKEDLTSSRKLIHYSIDESLKVLIIRAKDVPTFVENGGADLGIVGKDILIEEPGDVYEMLDLRFGYCRIVVAEPEDTEDHYCRKGYLRIATKYPNITERFFSQKAVQFEIIKLYGSVELAPHAGIADLIVDLVSTGNTLRANRLREVETIFESTARLIVNRISFKTNNIEVTQFITRVKEKIDETTKY
jgi:ATP phosphoribosyltransferase